MSAPPAPEDAARFATLKGDSYAYLTHPFLQTALGRILNNYTEGGITAKTMAENPSSFPVDLPNTMVWLSIGAVDLLQVGTPGYQIEAIASNIIAVCAQILSVPGTRVVHVGYNDGIPDPPASIVRSINSLWPTRYVFVPLTALDRPPQLVQRVPPNGIDATGLHLRQSDYDLRVGAVLLKLKELGWSP